MGYGEFMGNGSVHWRVLHEEYEEEAQATARTIGKKPPKRLARARLRTADVPPNKPAEHVANLDVLDYEARGKDTIPFSQIGRCDGRKDHQGSFRVQLRYKTLREARAALRLAAQRIRLDRDMYVVTLDVPAIDRTAEQVGPPPNPPAEVKVDW